MGYYLLDRAKALMYLEVKTGIDCAKRVISEERSTTLPQNYHLKYPDSHTTEQELREIAARVHKEGFVLLWSHVLKDFAAFYNTEADREKIPLGFVPYSKDELWGLFGEEKKYPSRQTLRLIHEAKKLGGCVVDNEGIQ